MPNVPLTPLAKLRDVYETMANLRAPARVLGVAINSRLLTPEDWQTERDRVRAEFDLPVCDVIRDGPTELVSAILDFDRFRPKT
jgi:uncharacterized NAD-dependent epimerase/dehydratase family protein